MKKLIVAIDIDGVILNFMQSIVIFVKDHYGVESHVPFCHEQHYNLADRFDTAWTDSVGWENIKQAFADAGGWTKLVPMGFTDSFKELFQDPRIEVQIVTMIDPKYKEDRKHNLEQLLGFTIDADKLHCVPLTGSKVPVIEAIRPDVFIEDSYKHLEKCAGAHLSIWIDTWAFDQGVPPREKSPEVVSALHFDGAMAHVMQLAKQMDAEVHDAHSEASVSF